MIAVSKNQQFQVANCSKRNALAKKWCFGHQHHCRPTL